MNNCIFQVWREMLSLMALVHGRFVGEYWNQSLTHTCEVLAGLYSRQIMLLVHVLNKILLVLIDITLVSFINFSLDFIVKVLYPIYRGVCYLVLYCFILYFTAREP